MSCQVHCHRDGQAGIPAYGGECPVYPLVLRIPGHEKLPLIVGVKVFRKTVEDEPVIVVVPFPAFENLHGPVSQRYVNVMHSLGLHLNLLQYFPCEVYMFPFKRYYVRAPEPAGIEREEEHVHYVPCVPAPETLAIVMEIYHLVRRQILDLLFPACVILVFGLPGYQVVVHYWGDSLLVYISVPCGILKGSIQGDKCLVDALLADILQYIKPVAHILVKDGHLDIVKCRLRTLEVMGVEPLECLDVLLLVVPCGISVLVGPVEQVVHLMRIFYQALFFDCGIRIRLPLFAEE